MKQAPSSWASAFTVVLETTSKKLAANSNKADKKKELAKGKVSFNQHCMQTALHTAFY
jgi:hypothetical protein